MSDPGVSLSKPERIQFGNLETVIERGLRTFVEVGAALMQIRDGRLYRESHKSFDDYCRARWGWSRQRSDQLISAATVIEELTTTVVTLPANEAQARELASVPKEKRPEVWEAAQESAKAEGKPVATRHIREAAAREPVEYDPADDAPDPVEEWERAEKEVARLNAVLDGLQLDDLGTQYRALSAKYAALEGRLRQAITTKNEAERTAKYAQGVLRKVREALGVQRDSEIIDAIRDMMR